MAFFGLETRLPRDKSKGIFEQSNPFPEAASERKLQAFRGGEEEEYASKMETLLSQR